MVSMLFGIHCHQPVENFYEVVDEAIEKAYKPFLTVAKYYPKFKFSVHYSGWLFEYIKNYSKETFKLLQDLAYNGQIEFFTGGYYEPILASIPSDDRKYQIEKLNNFIKQNFGQAPKGLWLTERVWDSSIVPDIVELGVEYVIVDDYHFLSTGFKKDSLYGYYNTQVDKYKIKIFPIDKNLRYLIPFKPIDKISEYLESIKTFGKNPAGIIFDDGEKFGIWPKTYDWVYNSKWIYRFLDEFTSRQDLSFEHYKTYAKNNKPLGLAYLPITSYQEMGEWSLFSEDIVEYEELKEFLEKNGLNKYYEKYVKGNIWHNFLIKYPESNRIHKRFLDLSISNTKYKKFPEFLDNLLKAQCNDVLWHGIFGGIYLPNLRNNAYRFIIKAEKELEKINKLNEKIQVNDFNFDGFDEVKISTKNLILIFDSKEAGQLIELSVKDKEFNFQNTLKRYKEGYHYKLLNPKNNNHTEEEGISTIHNVNINIAEEIKNILIYDWYNKNSFIDHITDYSFNLESFYRCSFRELSDFTNQPFEFYNYKNQIMFKREGGIYLDKKFNSTLVKTYKINENTIECLIKLETEYKEPLKYVLEFNFHFANLPDFYKSPQYHGKEKIFRIFDNFTGKTIKIETSHDMEIFSYPIETLSQSEKGVDITNQGLTIGFSIDFKENLEIKVLLEVKD